MWHLNPGQYMHIQCPGYSFLQENGFFRANSEQLDGHGIRLSEYVKMSKHLSLSKRLSRKYAVIVHLIHPQCNTMYQRSVQQSDMCWDCDPVGKESCKTCAKEKWQINRGSGLLASSLWGTSAAPRKEMEHLGRHAETSRPRGHTIAAPARGFMSFTSLNIHQSPHGGYSTVPRERVRQWWIYPLSRLLWASFHSSRACSCLGKHIRALQRLCTGDLGILMQWEWLPWTQLVQGSSRRIWMWSPWCHL